MKSIGLVIVNVADDFTKRSLNLNARQAMQATPPGRTIAFIFSMPSSWAVSRPVESVLTDTILGRASHRGSDPEWEFAGNLAVRICNPLPDSRDVLREVGVLLFRRVGDKPYVRSKIVDSGLKREANMQTLHPVFTRDVANNVWHLRPSYYRTRIRKRLGPLLAWPDESILVISGATSRRYSNVPLDLETDLIGVPKKVDYEWRSNLEGLFGGMAYSCETVLQRGHCAVDVRLTRRS